MSLFQAVLVIAGLVIAALASDVLHSHDRASWPVGLGVIALALVGGYARNAEIVSFMLGWGVGWLLVGGYHQAQRLQQQRRLRAEQVAAQKEARRRQLQG